MTAVYPKQDPEYRKLIMEQFYRQVQDTKWPTEEEKIYKPRGRKAKIIGRPESQPRTELERKAKYNWFNK